MLAILGLAIVLGYGAKLWRDFLIAGVTLERFENLRLDMSEEDVEWFLGPPTGAECVEFVRDETVFPEAGTLKVWQAEHLKVRVTFSADGRATFIQHETKTDGIWSTWPPTRKRKEAIMERIRRSIGFH